MTAYAAALPDHMLEGAPGPIEATLTAALTQPLSRAIIDAGRAEYDRLLAPAKVAKATDIVVAEGFEVTDPRALAYAQQHAADLVTAITAQQRAAIRQVIETAFTDQVTGPTTARRLRTVVGLSPRYATAVDNMHAQQLARLIRTGINPERAAEMAYEAASRYRDRLIRSRANTIARTEIMDAQNHARHLAVTQQVEQGLLSPYSRKKWVAHDPAGGISDPCRLCSALHGTTRRWDEAWDFGGQRPPRHPNCRCVQVILPPALEGDDDYLAELSSPAIDEAVAASQEAWRGAENPADWSMTDLGQVQGATLRKRLWTEAGDNGDWAVYERFPHGPIGTIQFIPTQRALDAAATTERAGRLIRRRAEARMNRSDPGLLDAVKGARRAVKEAEAAVASAPGWDYSLVSQVSVAKARLRLAEQQYSDRLRGEIVRTIREHRTTAAPIEHMGDFPTAITAERRRALADVIPDDWKRGIIAAKVEEGVRAHAGRDRITLDEFDGPEVYAHEVMHVLDAQNPLLRTLVWAWLGGRVHRNRHLWNRLRVKPLSDIDRGYTDSERYLLDAEMRRPYAAKVYGPGGTLQPDGPEELLPMALAQLMLRDSNWTIEDEALDLLIGALVSL